jgi:hypothetical protein
VRERPVDRTALSAAGGLDGAGRSVDAFTNIEVLERGRGPRGDRSMASEWGAQAGVRATSRVDIEPDRVLAEAAIAS